MGVCSRVCSSVPFIDQGLDGVIPVPVVGLYQVRGDFYLIERFEKRTDECGAAVELDSGVALQLVGVVTFIELNFKL